MKTAPRSAQKLLRKVLRDELVEDVMGDLDEKYHKKLNQGSAFRANFYYWFQTINYLRPFAVKRRRAHINPQACSAAT